jgi:hypothetical protein
MVHTLACMAGCMPAGLLWQGTLLGLFELLWLLGHRMCHATVWKLQVGAT